MCVLTRYDRCSFYNVVYLIFENQKWQLKSGQISFQPQVQCHIIHVHMFDHSDLKLHFHIPTYFCHYFLIFLKKSCAEKLQIHNIQVSRFMTVLFHSTGLTSRVCLLKNYPPFLLQICPKLCYFINEQSCLLPERSAISEKGGGDRKTFA